MTKLSDKIFSIKKQNQHKLLSLFGIKFKFYSAKSAGQFLNQKLQKCEQKNKTAEKALKDEIYRIEQENKSAEKALNEYIQKIEQKNKNAEKSLNEYIQKIEQENKSSKKALKEEILRLEKENKTLRETLDREIRRINILNLEKKLISWKMNFLSDFIDNKEFKRQVVNQRFFYGGHHLIPNIDNPKTFNEKILWLREHYLADNPLIDRIADKYLFKDYITQKIGSEYVIPLLGQWSCVQDIDFDKLPDSFVLKSTWGSDDNHVLLVEDKNTLNLDEIKDKLMAWLTPWGNPYYYHFTPGFKTIEPRIIAEEFIKSNNNYMLDDYKFFCFNGKFQLGYVNIRMKPKGRIYYFDKQWQLLPIVQNGLVCDAKYFPEKPACFEKLVELAEILAADFPFARIDFYIPENKIYVGEITFTPGGGFNKYTPEEWNYKMGEMLDISYLKEETHSDK